MRIYISEPFGLAGPVDLSGLYILSTCKKDLSAITLFTNVVFTGGWFTTISEINPQVASCFYITAPDILQVSDKK